LIAGHRGAAILVVEDEPANRSLLRAVLARSKDAWIRELPFYEAASLAEARRVLSVEQIGLVILDVRLPDGSGLDLARELNELAGRGPRVLILSASVLPADREAAATVGVDAFLGKPYAPSALLEAIGALLRDEEFADEQ
jgi:DNA-binding response OmpR family regulator